MVEMCVDPERAMLVEESKEIVSDAHGQHHRFPGSDADELHMRNGPHLSQDVVQLLQRQSQRIATADKYIPHFFVLPQISYRLIDLIVARCGIAYIPVAFADAETAIARTKRRHDKENTVRISMSQPGRDLVVLLRKRVQAPLSCLLNGTRNDHAPDR